MKKRQAFNDIDTGFDNNIQAFQVVAQGFSDDMQMWLEEARPFDRTMLDRIIEVVEQIFELQTDAAKMNAQALEHVLKAKKPKAKKSRTK